MDILSQIFSFAFGVKRSFDKEWVSEDQEFSEKNLLGVSFYNFGSSPVKINDFTLRAYDEARGPDIYVLDTLPYTYEDGLKLPIEFTGAEGLTKKVYITYSVLRKCK